MDRRNEKKKIIFCLLLLAVFSSTFFLFGNGLCLAQEQVTITTYYPAPYGVYNELRSKRMAIGDTYYDPVSTTVPASSLIVENAIGVGTKTPGGKFEVNMGDNNNFFRINNDNDIGVELRSGTSGGTPYIDFSNDASTDPYDMRIILTNDDTLSVLGGGLNFDVNIDAAQTVDPMNVAPYTPQPRFRNKSDVS